MNKNRLEAFTDAIIAIAATIMVLELRIPEVNSLHGLLEECPIFLAYLISFTLIYTVWYNHHNLFEKITQLSRRTYFLNGIWLFVLTLVPFASNWVGKSSNDTIAEFVFAFVLLLWSILFQILDRQVIKDNYSARRDATNTFGYRCILYGGYLSALIVAFMLPILSMLIIAIITISMTIQLFFID
ncbi:DUF1211 domain-containing protein [Weissella diestrammenae]|uniref:DUF1211 domain-containing protein n=1 Tax=Weissella diestrammenae TaxID=1162633 RepID=A0A7G9T5G8_9LACO|nr:TMEM175 family protein [Weissella diestrammenae]MCM0583204.1 DUF1211 domain-containing protein [Weissella diestrammenae]QNN75343.1 DUF1211 domain-containing protein [Weissella diestrammenae]